jgi:hypothetical protein
MVVITRDLVAEYTSEEFADITILDLSELQVTHIGEELEEFQSLETLLLNHNNITEISAGQFKENKNLWKLDLSYNDLTSIEGLLDYYVFGSLNLAHNPKLSLSELQQLSEHVEILVELNIDGCDYQENRSQLIQFFPNIWVLNDIFISDRERGDSISSHTPPIFEEHDILGRRAAIMHRVHVENQQQRLLYLLDYYNENYLLERSLVSLIAQTESGQTSRSISTDGSSSTRARSTTSSSHRKLDQYPDDDAFHRKELSGLIDSDPFKRFLRATILFNIGREAQYECLNQVLQDLIKLLHFEQITTDIVQLPKYARQALLLDMYGECFVDNDLMGEEQDRILIAQQFYDVLRQTSCFSNADIRQNDLHSYLDYIVENTELDTNPAEYIKATVTNVIVTPTVEQQEEVQEQYDTEFQASHRKSHRPKENPMYKLTDSQDSSFLYSPTARVPKIGEPVLHVLSSGRVIKGRVIELFPSGVITVSYQKRAESIPVNKMTWNAKGCWVINEAAVTRSINSSHSITKKKSTDVSMFTSNESWTSEFLMSSDDIVYNVNKHQKQGVLGPKWSKLNDNIPFRIFQIDEEFVIQPPRQQTINNNHQLHFVNPQSNTFMTTVPDEEEEIVNDRQIRDNAITATQGGMNVSVPNILLPERKQARNNSATTTPPVKLRPNHREWTIIPGKSRFIVHNPLENHPYTMPTQKRDSTVRFVQEPTYTRGFMIDTRKQPDLLPLSRSPSLTKKMVLHDPSSLPKLVKTKSW